MAKTDYEFLVNNSLMNIRIRPDQTRRGNPWFTILFTLWQSNVATAG